MYEYKYEVDYHTVVSYRDARLSMIVSFILRYSYSYIGTVFNTI